MPSNPAIDRIRAEMTARELTQEALADLMGRAQPVISEILNGKRVISPEIALELETALGGSFLAEELLNLQAKHQLDEARNSGKSDEIRLKARLREEFPILEMEKRGWIPKRESVREKVQAALAFARNSPDLDQIIAPFEVPTLARQSATLGYLSPLGAGNRAWQYRVRQLAEITPAKEFDHQRFVTEGMKTLRKLARTLKGVAEIPQTLAQFGVRLVIVEHMEKTKLNGATMWLDPEMEKKPVIALTLRYGKIDNIWFTLAHELQHIVKRHSFSLNCDGIDEYEADALKEIENDADASGLEWLIPQSRLRAFVDRRGGRIGKDAIEAFAEVIDIHPGILVGILQHDGVIGRKLFNDFRVEARRHILMSSMSDGFGQPNPLQKPNQ